MKPVMMFLLVLFAAPCFAQDTYRSGSRHGDYVRYGERYQVNPPRIYSSSGTYLGELSRDKYAPDSISNAHGRYGSRHSPDSINNAYGRYGVYSARPLYVYPGW